MLPASASIEKPPTTTSAGSSTAASAAADHQTPSTIQESMTPAIDSTGILLTDASAKSPRFRIASRSAIPQSAAAVATPKAMKKSNPMLTRASMAPAPCGVSGFPRRRAAIGTPM